jgi:hypothetical protein
MGNKQKEEENMFQIKMTRKEKCVSIILRISLLSLQHDL